MQKTTLDIEKHRPFLDAAIAVAKLATCERRYCGSVVVHYGEIIGRGYNSPPQELETQRRCAADKALYQPKITDKTCCMHAEQRAVLDALRHAPEKVPGSTLYFVAINQAGELVYSGAPYCTLCSKLALDVGIKDFVLWHAVEELVAYSTEYYNDLSYMYQG